MLDNDYPLKFIFDTIRNRIKSIQRERERKLRHITIRRKATKEIIYFGSRFHSFQRWLKNELWSKINFSIKNSIIITQIAFWNMRIYKIAAPLFVRRILSFTCYACMPVHVRHSFSIERIAILNPFPLILSTLLLYKIPLLCRVSSRGREYKWKILRH